MLLGWCAYHPRSARHIFNNKAAVNGAAARGFQSDFWYNSMAASSANGFAAHFCRNTGLAARWTRADSAEAGFTMLEMVCVLAIAALLAAILLPRLPGAASRPRLEAAADVAP
jgi:prepilin-type N-terminal cleavage/methylation domain-containing protein